MTTSIDHPSTPGPLAVERWEAGYSGEVQLSVRPPIEGNDAPTLLFVEPSSGFLALTRTEAITLARRLLQLSQRAAASPYSVLGRSRTCSRPNPAP